jgi:hypothetical protein
LVNSCPSLLCFVTCIKPSKWEGTHWELVAKEIMRLAGSGMQRTMYIYKRGPKAPKRKPKRYPTTSSELAILIRKLQARVASSVESTFADPEGIAYIPIDLSLYSCSFCSLSLSLSLSFSLSFSFYIYIYIYIYVLIYRNISLSFAIYLS